MEKSRIGDRPKYPGYATLELIQLVLHIPYISFLTSILGAYFFKLVLLPMFLYNHSLRYLLGPLCGYCCVECCFSALHTDTGTPPSTCTVGGTAAGRPGTTQQTRRAAFASSTTCIVASLSQLPRCPFKNSIVASKLSFLTSRTCRLRIHRLRFSSKILPRCAHSFRRRANTARLCATRSSSPSLT
jgi:hypothetical protein